MKFLNILTGLLIFGGLSVVPQAFGDFSMDGEYPWGKLDDSLVTPHREIYKPLSGKRPKLFFVGFQYGLRDIAEFRQRFDCDFAYWCTSNNNTFSPYENLFGDKKNRIPYAPSMDKQTYLEERARIFGQLDSCDAVIVGRFPFEMFPADIQKKFLNFVNGGKTLIFVLRDKKLPAIKGVSFQAGGLPADFEAAKIPSIAGTRIYRANYGKGKIIAIEYPVSVTHREYTYLTLMPCNANDPLYFEYANALLGRIVRDNISKNTPVLSFKGEKLAVAGTVPAGAKVRVEFYDHYGKLIMKQMQNPNETVRIPAGLPSSTAMMDAFLLDAQGKVLSHTFRRQKALAADRIESLKLDSDITDASRNLTGTIKMTGKPRGVLLFTAKDEYGREVFRKEIPAVAGTRKFKYQVPAFDCHGALLRVIYLRDGKISDEKQIRIYFPVDRKMFLDDYQLAVWCSAATNSKSCEVALSQLKKAGADIVMDTATKYFSVAADITPRMLHKAGLSYAIYLCRLVGEFKYQKLCNFSLADAVRENKSYYDKNGKPFFVAQRGIEATVKGAAPFNVAFYNLGDENAICNHNNMKDRCFCAECQARFRVWLKKLYGSIEALNKEYGSKFKDFSEIQALPLDKAAEKELLPMWLDFRKFMDYSFIEWHKMVIDTIRQYDKESFCGIEGMAYPANCYSGFDLAQMFPNFDFCAPYFNSRDVHAMKYLKSPSFRAAWYGSYQGEMSEQYVRRPPWRYLFAGLGGAFWYSAIAPGYSQDTVFRHDLGLLSHFTQSMDEVGKMKRSGIAKLIIDGKKTQYGIAVHYSQSCLYASALNPDNTSWELSIGNVGDLIESLGLEYEYMTPAEIENGELRRFKVLFLPNSQALSAKEVEAIRKFTREGGLLIADYNPGIMNEHGKFLPDSQLSDVFGSMDKLNVKAYGKGTAVYLFDYIDGVSQKIKQDTAVGIQNGILALFRKHAGVQQWAKVTTAKGSPAQECKVFDIKGGKLVTILAPVTVAGAEKKSVSGAESGASGTVVNTDLVRNVELQQPKYVYDLGKNGKYLGKIRNFRLELEPALGRVIACMDEPAEKPTLRAPSALVRGKSAEFTIGSVKNACRVRIESPDKKEVFRKNISNGRFQFIPPFNALAGSYKVIVTNPIGGASVQVEIPLK